MSKTNTYWVSFSWTYLLWMGDVCEEGENEWDESEYCEAMRFRCPKKDVKKEVEAYVKNELKYDKYKDLKITIEDCYLTSDEEL